MGKLSANSPMKLRQCKRTLKGLKASLRFVYTRDLDLAISPSDAISIEFLPSFQIATAGDSDKV
jgi:hypothetical protein